MTDRQLRKFVTGFRSGLLAGRPSTRMCFAVCAPLQTLLGMSGVETEIEEVNFSDINHVWLRMKDGRIIDPTADQFGLEPVYIGPLPLSYETRKARLVDQPWPSAHAVAIACSTTSARSGGSIRSAWRDGEHSEWPSGTIQP